HGPTGPRAGRLAAPAVGQRLGDQHRHDLAEAPAAVAVEVHDSVTARAPRGLAWILSRAAVHENGQNPALEGTAPGGAPARGHLQEAAVPPRLGLLRRLI